MRRKRTKGKSTYYHVKDSSRHVVDDHPQMRKGGCGYYDVTAHIFLILSLTFTLNEEGVGEGLRGVLWRWVIVGVVGARSQWVGGGDPLEN